MNSWAYHELCMDEADPIQHIQILRISYNIDYPQPEADMDRPNHTASALKIQLTLESLPIEAWSECIA